MPAAGPPNACQTCSLCTPELIGRTGTGGTVQSAFAATTYHGPGCQSMLIFEQKQWSPVPFPEDPKIVPFQTSADLTMFVRFCRQKIDDLPVRRNDM